MINIIIMLYKGALSCRVATMSLWIFFELNPWYRGIEWLPNYQFCLFFQYFTVSNNLFVKQRKKYIIGLKILKSDYERLDFVWRKLRVCILCPLTIDHKFINHSLYNPLDTMFDLSCQIIFFICSFWPLIN